MVNMELAFETAWCWFVVLVVDDNDDVPKLGGGLLLPTPNGPAFELMVVVFVVVVVVMVVVDALPKEKTGLPPFTDEVVEGRSAKVEFIDDPKMGTLFFA